jgi:hypothetical protein
VSVLLTLNLRYKYDFHILHILIALNVHYAYLGQALEFPHLYMFGQLILKCSNLQILHKRTVAHH